MGVSYTAILAIGKEFDDAEEVVEFLKKRGQLSKEALIVLAEEGDSYIQELIDNRRDRLYCECLNCYTGYGYYLGFRISCRSPEEFEKSFNSAKQKWAELFPNDPAEIIHCVRVS